MTRESVAGVVLIAFLFIAPSFVSADEDEHSLEQLVVEMAESPQQHAALAEYYRSKADAARSEAQRHEKMGRSYSRGKLTQRNAMRRHCQEIAKQQASLAKEYEALARLHEKDAKAK